MSDTNDKLKGIVLIQGKGVPFEITDEDMEATDQMYKEIAKKGIVQYLVDKYGGKQ